MKSVRFNRVIGLALVLGLLPFYQNCGVLNFNSEASKPQMSGNGESYTGKPELYASYDPSRPCAQLDNLNSPFPNKQLAFGGGVAEVVREACTDITPRPIDPQQIALDATTQAISYAGERFSLIQDFTPLNTVPLACPGSRTVIPFDRTANLYRSPFDFSKWIINNGIQVTQEGVIGALPRFRIQRNNPSYLQNFRRVTQRPKLTAGVQYAASFLIQAGNRPGATIYFWNADDKQFDAEFNVLLGAADVRPVNMPGMTTKITPYAGGHVITIFFTSPGTTADMGISVADGWPDQTYFGDFVYATAGDLRPVDSYCSP